MTSSIDQDSRRTLTFMLYILYMVAIFTGGLLAFVALIVNYVKLSAMKGSIFESHFRWQIRTFWWYLIWSIVAFIPFLFLFFVTDNPDIFAGMTLGATIFCGAVIILSWLWIIYRAIKGIIRLNDNQPI